MPGPVVRRVSRSLGAHHGGSGSEVAPGVDAMIRDLFSPTVPQEFRDLQAIALLTSLSESSNINHTTRAALVYAAERLWGLLEEAVDIVEDPEPDGPEGDDGPLSLGAPDEDGEPSLSSLGPSSVPPPSPGTLPDRMFR